MLALFLVALVDSAVLVTLLFAPFAFGQGVSQPSLQSLVTRFGTERTRGQLLGLNQSARSLALIFGPVWAGYAYEAISPRAVFLVGSGIVLVAVLCALLLLRQEMPAPRQRRRQALAE
jgi:predicted MFS family arabinose efflux permease